MSIKVISYKKIKSETETVMSYGDVLNIVEENLGSDIVNAILDYSVEDLEEKLEEKSVVTYIEDGIFSEQIKESGLIDKLIANILVDLEDQGYLKKSKKIEKFIPNEDELVEFIDEKLSPGMMKYFE